MDGTLRTAIVSSKIYWPNGLSIDYPNKLLYFVDAYLDYIDFCDYNGNNRRQVVASDLVWKKNWKNNNNRETDDQIVQMFIT